MGSPTHHDLQGHFPEPDVTPLELEHLVAEGATGPVFYVIVLARDPRTRRLLVQKISGVEKAVRHRKLWARFPSDQDAERFFHAKVRQKRRAGRTRQYRRSCHPLRWRTSP